ncbi:GntR family transcriptional regulator [Micromonospora soli]|uniref:GntR family transcriptional regulator n=1 Tax=Micromonospora sp. NBRC 110009 TaxID=3061627 RepID=UPI0034A00E66
MVLAPVTGRGTAEVIFRRLTEGIASGALQPGDCLPREEEIARIFGVAPMPLRQGLPALRNLEYVETLRVPKTSSVLVTILLITEIRTPVQPQGRLARLRQ